MPRAGLRVGRCQNGMCVCDSLGRYIVIPEYVTFLQMILTNIFPSPNYTFLFANNMNDTLSALF